MHKFLAPFLFILLFSPAGLSAQGKYLSPGFGLHISPWKTPTHVPSKARSLQPQRAPRPRQMRSPLEFMPLEGKAAFAAVELRHQSRDPLWVPPHSQHLQLPAGPALPEPSQRLPPDFRALKNLSIRPPPAL